MANDQPRVVYEWTGMAYDGSPRYRLVSTEEAPVIERGTQDSMGRDCWTVASGGDPGVIKGLLYSMAGEWRWIAPGPVTNAEMLKASNGSRLRESIEVLSASLDEVDSHLSSSGIDHSSTHPPARRATDKMRLALRHMERALDQTE